MVPLPLVPFFARLPYLDTRISGPEQVRNGMLPGVSRETLCPQPYVTAKPCVFVYLSVFKMWRICRGYGTQQD